MYPARYTHAFYMYLCTVFYLLSKVRLPALKHLHSTSFLWQLVELFDHGTLSVVLRCCAHFPV